MTDSSKNRGFIDLVRRGGRLDGLGGSSLLLELSSDSLPSKSGGMMSWCSWGEIVRFRTPLGVVVLVILCDLTGGGMLVMPVASTRLMAEFVSGGEIVDDAGNGGSALAAARANIS